jgi:hypothetical protein
VATLLLAGCTSGRTIPVRDTPLQKADSLATGPSLPRVAARDDVVAREASPPAVVPSPSAPAALAVDSLVPPAAPAVDSLRTVEPLVVDAASAVRWSGDVTVTGRGRAVDVRVTWTVVAPDSAIIELRPAAEGTIGRAVVGRAVVGRTVILAGRRGWAIEDGHRRPLGDAPLRAELEDLWLWEHVRGAAALDSTCRVRSTRANGVRTDIVRCQGRPTVTRHAGANGRLERLEADVFDPVREATRRVVYSLEGGAVGGGLPSVVRVAHDEAPFATIRIVEVATAVRVDRRAFRP